MKRSGAEQDAVRHGKKSAPRSDADDAKARDRFDYDGSYKRVLGTPGGLAQFLQAFDPAVAAALRLDTLIPRSSDLFDALPPDYSRIADIVAEVRTHKVASPLVVVHLEVQSAHRSARQGALGRRMLDYYTLLRRTLNVPVLPYAVLLYGAKPALGRKTYAETFEGWDMATATYFQVSLPSLNPADFATHPTPLARALSGMMKAPLDEAARQALYRQATDGVLTALRERSLSEDAGAALWKLIHHALPYQFEVEVDRAVDWSEEDVEMVQQLDRQWLQNIIAEGEARGKAEGLARGKAEGEALGLLRAKRSWLLRDMARRFGPLPASLTARIEAVDDEAALDRAKESLDTAASLSDLVL